MTNHSPCLLDDAAAFMKVQYLSDLQYLSPYQQKVLATFFESLDATQYTLFQWNDALTYLGSGRGEQSIQAARNKLLRTLQSYGHIE